MERYDDPMNDYTESDHESDHESDQESLATSVGIQSEECSPSIPSVSSSPLATSYLKPQVKPFVDDDMDWDEFTSLYSKAKIKTMDDEMIILNQMLRTFRIYNHGKPVAYLKKKKCNALNFDMLKESDLVQTLKKFTLQKSRKLLTEKKKDAPYTFADIFLKNRDYFLVKDIKFEPNLTPTKNIINLFTGWQAKKVEEVDMDKIKPVFRHIKKIFCSGNQECYHYMVKWMAHIIQKPRDKVPVGIILQSEQGAGKDLFFKWFIDYVLGEKLGLTTQYIEAVVGRFNSLMENKMLVVVNEITSNGKNPKYETYEIMKSLISEKKQKIERKGFEPINVNSYSRFVFCSNSEKPIHIEEGDRRYFVLKFKKNPDQKYYTDLADLLENNAESAQDIGNHFYTYLTNCNLTGFYPQIFPKTEAKEELRETCMGSAERFIRSHTWVGKILNTQLYKVYNDWCKENNYQPENNHYFGIKIKKYVSAARLGKQTAKIRNNPSDNDKQINVEVIAVETIENQE
jgi:hypothetical protein